MKNSTWTSAALAAGALGLAAAAYAQMPGELPASGPDAPGGVVSPAPGPDDAQIDKRPQGIDAEFVDKAGLAGKSEVDAGRLALERSTSPDVRTFAKRMVADHGKANDQLRALGARKGVPVQAARIVDPDVEALRGKSGHDFDVAYVAAAGPAPHRQAVQLFEDEARNGHDPDLRAFAKTTLPTLRHHLAMAQALARKVGAQ
jgi:putative membrane protein